MSPGDPGGDDRGAGDPDPAVSGVGQRRPGALSLAGPGNAPGSLIRCCQLGMVLLVAVTESPRRFNGLDALDFTGT